MLLCNLGDVEETVSDPAESAKIPEDQELDIDQQLQVRLFFVKTRRGRWYIDSINLYYTHIQHEILSTSADTTKTSQGFSITGATITVNSYRGALRPRPSKYIP